MFNFIYVCQRKDESRVDNQTMYQITFKTIGSQAAAIVLNDIAAGQSLLEVAIDHSIGLRHDCGGMSSCGTCHIFLEEGNEFVEFRSKRETHQLAKKDNTGDQSRLACQCVLLPGTGALRVDLPSDYFIHSTIK